jgi:hypothetical protein
MLLIMRVSSRFLNGHLFRYFAVISFQWLWTNVATSTRGDARFHGAFYEHQITAINSAEPQQNTTKHINIQLHSTTRDATPYQQHDTCRKDADPMDMSRPRPLLVRGNVEQVVATSKRVFSMSNRVRFVLRFTL